MAKLEVRVVGPSQNERPAFAADAALVAALRAGNAAAIAAPPDRYHAPMVLPAMLPDRDRASAEEVTQET